MHGAEERQGARALTSEPILQTQPRRGVWHLIGPALSWRRLSPARRALARVAAVELVRAWALVRFRPFATYVSRLGTAMSGDPEWDWDGDPRVLVDIRWAVRRWSRASGGHFTCLMQAMAVQALLARQGVSSAVVLGVKPGRAGADPTAHAWLRVGQWVIVGGEERDGHLAVASYSRSARR